MAEALSVGELCVSYGAVRVLEVVSFEAQRGEVIGIIGPNGAGKSTLVKALCGGVHPTSGHVEINGQPMRPHIRRSHLIGLVPQQIGLYPHLTGRENLHVFGRIAGLKGEERAERVSRALDIVAMTERADRPVDTMSGGMQRRINVAAAILHDPPVVIFDEPTAGVDHPARDVIHQLAGRLAKQGHAVLLVTHELEQCEALCDRVLVLEKGRVIGFAAPIELLATHFGDDREVIVRFRSEPDEQTHAAIAPFAFQQAELPTVWIARTRASEVSFVSAFMSALPNRDELVREVTVRRPGLASLMQGLDSV